MNSSVRNLLLAFFFVTEILGKVVPIQFSIPEEKIVSCIPKKDTDFAYCVPGNPSTYVFENESDYYFSYQRALYGLTMKKGGWDCLRHYEILANGCIPYFIDLELSDPQTMVFLPKDLILEAMHLPGVSYLKIDHSIFEQERYDVLLEQLLAYTQESLTSRKIAEYLLEQAGYSGKGPVLYLVGDINPDYLKCLTFIGLRQVLGVNAIDVPRIDHLYQDYPSSKELYGKGMTYSMVLDPIDIGRSRIEERILNGEFELIIYGSIHRGLPLHDLVKMRYPSCQIVYLCGEDAHICEYAYADEFKNSLLFLREFEASIPKQLEE